MNPNQLVYIKCHDFDKYGRTIGGTSYRYK